MKKLFTRVRIPLTKLEPASAFEETDYGDVELMIDPANGRLGWRISATKAVYRRELADQFLEWLLRARAADNHFPESQRESE